MDADRITIPQKKNESVKWLTQLQTDSLTLQLRSYQRR